MDIETYGGRCPCCEKPMLQKGDDSTHGFHFDACPHCGFACGESNNETMDAAPIWGAVLDHHGVADLPALRAYVASLEPDDTFWPSVMDYAGKDRDALKARCLPHASLAEA